MTSRRTVIVLPLVILAIFPQFAFAGRPHTEETVMVLDPLGRPVGRITSGQQVVLSSVVKSHVTETQPFVVIVEVRDADGITVYLAWQSGIMSSDRSSSYGMSWIAESPGDYQIRRFLVNNMTNPQVLGPVITTEIQVF